MGTSASIDSSVRADTSRDKRFLDDSPFQPRHVQLQALITRLFFERTTLNCVHDHRRVRKNLLRTRTLVIACGGIAACSTLGHPQRHLTMLTLPAQECPPPELTITFEPAKLEQDEAFDVAFTPMNLCMHILQDKGDCAHQTTRNFRVFSGSRCADASCKDAVGIDRLNSGTWFSTAMHPSELGKTTELGSVIALEYGYVLLSGTGPIAVGRRVRAASDGTQFAIERLFDGTERVYLIEMADPHPLYVELTGVDGPVYIVMSKNDEGAYVEVKASGEVIRTPTKPKAGTPEAHFLKQMNVLLKKDTLPTESTIEFINPVHNPEPIRRESLNTMFARRFPKAEAAAPAP